MYFENIPVLVINLSHCIEMSTHQINGTFCYNFKKTDHTDFPFMWPVPEEKRRNYVEISNVKFVVLFGKSRLMNLNTQVNYFKECSLLLKVQDWLV